MRRKHLPISGISGSPSPCYSSDLLLFPAQFLVLLGLGGLFVLVLGLLGLVEIVRNVSTCYLNDPATSSWL